MANRQNERLGDWITTAEAAEMLDLTARRVRQLADLGKFAYKMITARLMMVKRSDVERYKESLE